MDQINPQIIFEDEFLLVIDKPSGVTVNKSETVKDEPTVQSFLERKLQREISLEPNTEFAKRAGFVHRLDKETSGILLVAKNQKTLENLQKQFKERTTVKKYLCLVHGLVVPEKGTINAPVDRLPWNRTHFGVFPGGKEALTDYKVETQYVASLPNQKFSLLEVTPHTGRTHQIRVHLKYLGHPVVGDELYAGRKTARDDRKFCAHQFLHAAYIKFTHPDNGKLIEFFSPLPPDLSQVISSLTKAS